jgi:putative ABC transport system permease protein
VAVLISTVSQPSQAPTAQAAAAGAFNTLFLGLGAVALLVGAVGVANLVVGERQALAIS